MLDSTLSNTPYTSFKIDEPKKAVPTIELYSDTISKSMRIKKALISFLLFASLIWIITVNFFSGQYWLFLTIPSFLLLLILFFKSASFEIASQKNSKLVAKIAVFKALFGFVLTLILLFNHHVQLISWNRGSSVPITGTCLMEGLFLVVGILIYREIQKIVKILEFEFNDKQLANYFEITL